METRSVSRCVAIAAHGKRCQQSPFRGSPYCWHHTQSRKIFAPSRPPTLAPGERRAPAEAAAAPRESAAYRGDDLGAAHRPAATAAPDQARRLAEVLGPERVAELLDFALDPRDGAYLLLREEGELISERSEPEIAAAPGGRRQASG